MNSQIRAMITSAPHIALPLLTSRLVTKRALASRRASGLQDNDFLGSLEAAHLDTLEFRGEEGDALRLSSAPVMPVPVPPFAPSHMQDSQASRASKLAATALARFVQQQEEPLAPSACHAVAFGTDSPSGPVLESVWALALRHYSQLWVAMASVRPALAGQGWHAELVLPLDFRKLLTTLDRALSMAEVTAPPSEIYVAP
jgi:hypothetical protein